MHKNLEETVPVFEDPASAVERRAEPAEKTASPTKWKNPPSGGRCSAKGAVNEPAPGHQCLGVGYHNKCPHAPTTTVVTNESDHIGKQNFFSDGTVSRWSEFLLHTRENTEKSCAARYSSTSSLGGGFIPVAFDTQVTQSRTLRRMGTIFVGHPVCVCHQMWNKQENPVRSPHLTSVNTTASDYSCSSQQDTEGTCPQGALFPVIFHTQLAGSGTHRRVDAQFTDLITSGCVTWWNQMYKSPEHLF